MSRADPSRRADAYGGVLVSDDGRILLREPTNHHAGYVWTFPKGGPDPGESPEATALREVHEETGYRAQITGRLPGVFRGDASTTGFFLMKPLGPQEPFDEETARTVWVDPEEAKALVSRNQTPAGRARDSAVVAAVQRVLASG